MSNKKLEIESAKSFLRKVIRNDKSLNGRLSMDIKSEILNALRLTLGDEFGIEPDSIITEVRELDNGTNACLQQDRGDGRFWLNVDEDFWSYSTNIKFLEVMLHEFGHIKQRVDEKAGKKVPLGIKIRGDLLQNEDKWQKKGSRFRYAANRNELGANLFSSRKLACWIKDAFKQKEVNSELFSSIEWVLDNTLEHYMRFVKNRIKYQAWKLTNRMLGIDDKSHTYLESMTSDVPSYIKKVNEKHPIASYGVSAEDARLYINYTQGFGESLETCSEDQKLEKISQLGNYMRLDFADRIGIDPDDIGFCFVKWTEKPYGDFIASREIDKDSPLYGYFSYDLDSARRQMDLSMVAEDMLKAMDEAEKKKQQLQNE